MEATKSGGSKMEEELKDFDFVQFAMSDVHGIPRGKLIPREMVGQACRDGVGIYSGTQYLGVNCEIVSKVRVFQNFPNGHMRPLQPSVVRPLVWSSVPGRRVGLVLCQMELGEREVFEECPRLLAQRQVERLAQKGFRVKSAYECEFDLLKKDSQEPFGNSADVIPYANLDLMDRHSELLTDMLNVLRASGVHLEYFYSEYQAGQYEVTMQPQWGVGSADDAFLLRYGVRSFCSRRDLQATFLSLPFPNYHTAGLHYNHSLWSQDGKSNLFIDPSDPLTLSATARHWIAGLLEHAPALMALSSPTLNCYWRTGVGFAPGTIYWNMDDRLCAFRAKTAGGNVYLESRIPSSAGNPYLILAGTLAAGLDGVERKLTCPEPGRPQTPRMLPSTLEEALTALENDQPLRKALGDTFVQYFATVKREFEVERFSADAIATAKPEATPLTKDELLTKQSQYYLPFI